MTGATSDVNEGNVLEDLIGARLSRRKVMRLGLVAGAAVGATRLPRGAGAAGALEAAAAPVPSLGGLTPVPATLDAVSVAPGLVSSVLLRWGDPVVTGAPTFDPLLPSAAAQALQFGYNCDYTALLPHGADHLLWVNHEYTTADEMFPGYPDPTLALPADLQPFVDAELEAHGGSVVKLTRAGATFTAVADPLNRRVTATTPMRLSGPATAVVGTAVTGMLNNCAGGVTPWGTVLTCEENFNQYFANVASCPHPVAQADHGVYGLPNGPSERRWEGVYPARFDTAVAPFEPWKYGYVVEIDPTDPASVPVKHTALGRTKHEGANAVVAPDGRVVYTGDDERFQYTYKFVTADAWDPDDRAANLTLLERGTLYVARFEADGSGSWLPMVYAGHEVHWNSFGFTSQADICVHTRQAAATLGATKMDRPEDVEISPVTGNVFMALTNNTNRAVGVNPGTDAANPRPANKHGHIIEWSETGGDHSALTFRWDIFMLCGHGENAANLVASPGAATGPEQTWFGGWTGPSTLISCPDNLAFDQAGNLLVGTDGMPGTSSVADAVYVVPTTGAYRGRLVQLVGVPAGAEATGPSLSADDATLLVSVQHPGEGGVFPVGQPQLNQLSRWPDSTAAGAAAIAWPSVIQVVRSDGSKIVPTTTAKLVPLAPRRVLDTRTGLGTTTAGPLASDATLALVFDLAPAALSALAGVVLTTAVVDATAPGYLTVGPMGPPRPDVSSLNVDRAGQTRANLVTTAVGGGGALSFYLQSRAHVIADLNAVYEFVAGSRDGRYRAAGPARLLDTRTGGSGAGSGKVGAGRTLSVPVAGHAGVPSSGAAAVVLNVTVTEPDGPGYLSVFPGGTTAPNASNVNYTGTGQDVANQVIVPLAADGTVSVFSFAAAHVVIDVAGWFTDATAPESDSGLFVPLGAARVRDTRTGLGGAAGPLGAGATTTAPVAGVAGIPTTGVAAVVANITFAETAGPGYVTAWPSGAARPLASSVNAYAAGQVVANHATVPVGADGTISLYASTGGHVIVDVAGWYTA